MRKLQFLIPVVFSVCLSAAAQSANEELQRLRQHLYVEDGTMITMGEPKKLPTNSPLKVYLAFGLFASCLRAGTRRMWNARSKQIPGGLV